MHAGMAGRKIAACGGRVSPLLSDPDLGAYSVAIAMDTRQLQYQPVIFTSAIEQRQRFSAQHRYDSVNVAVVIKVSEGRSAASYRGQALHIRLLEFAGGVPEHD